MSDAYNPDFWRENARQLNEVASELSYALEVLNKFGMAYAAKSVEIRIIGLRASAKEDLAWAESIENGTINEQSRQNSS